MIARLRLHRDPPADSHALPPRTGADSVSSWLDVLTRMLPARQGAEVREELESHVRERVRDLVLAGQDETGAIRIAIGELGDAAAVAQRFREAARTPFRRLAMNLAVLGVAGAALMTSLVSVTRPGSGPGGQVYQPAAAERVSAGQEPGLPMLKFERTELGDALRSLAEHARAALMVRWSSLGESGIEPASEVTMTAPAGSVSNAFDAINSALSQGPYERVIDFRLHEGVLEVARPEWFDHRESTLVRYDLAPIEEQGVALDDFMSLVVQFISPGDWKENGGDLAEHRVVGSFAFVKGPPRVHDGVRWFVSQFTEREPPAGAPGAAAREGDPVRVYHIQHTDAQDLLKVLMQMQSIREVDFTPWAPDARTNSIIGRAPDAHHEMVARAIRDLDNPEAVLKRRTVQKNAEMRATIGAELAQHGQDRALLEAELEAMARRGISEDHQDVRALRARLKEAQDREAEARARLLMLELEAGEPDRFDRRGAAQPAVQSDLRLAEAQSRERAVTDFLTQTLVRQPVDTQPLVVDLLRRADLQLEVEPRIAVGGGLRLQTMFRLAQEPEPITRALLMAHTDAEAVAGALRIFVERGGEPYLCIEVDQSHNTVIVRGPTDHVLAAEEVAWKLDHLASVLPQRSQ